MFDYTPRACTGNDFTREYGVDGCGNVARIYGYNLCVPCFRELNKKRFYARVEEYKKKKNVAPVRKKRKPSGEGDLFNKIWTSREHMSELSGRTLPPKGNPYWVNCFAHLLPKGTYPELKFKFENVMLLHPEEHRLYDFGTSDQRIEYSRQWNCDWDVLYAKRQMLLKKLANDSPIE